MIEDPEKQLFSSSDLDNGLSFNAANKDLFSRSIKCSRELIKVGLLQAPTTFPSLLPHR